MHEFDVGLHETQYWLYWQLATGRSRALQMLSSLKQTSEGSDSFQVARNRISTDVCHGSTAESKIYSGSSDPSGPSRSVPSLRSCHRPPWCGHPAGAADTTGLDPNALMCSTTFVTCFAQLREQIRADVIRGRGVFPTLRGWWVRGGS